MPHYCIVPLCKNVSGTPDISFYRLPLNDSGLLKKWLIKIRRENTPINKHSRVCSAHFNGGKKQGKEDVPVVFAWTKPARPPPKSQRTASSSTISNEVDSLSPVDNSNDVTTLALNDNDLAVTSATNTCESDTIARHCVGIDADTQTIHDFIDVEIQVSKMTYVPCGSSTFSRS